MVLPTFPPASVPHGGGGSKAPSAHTEISREERGGIHGCKTDFRNEDSIVRASPRYCWEGTVAPLNLSLFGAWEGTGAPLNFSLFRAEDHDLYVLRLGLQMGGRCVGHESYLRDIIGPKFTNGCFCCIGQCNAGQYRSPWPEKRKRNKK